MTYDNVTVGTVLVGTLHSFFALERKKYLDTLNFKFLRDDGVVVSFGVSRIDVVSEAVYVVKP